MAESTETDMDRKVKEAEIEKSQAETRKLAAEAAKAEFEAVEAELKKDEAIRKENDRTASDGENNFYMFSGSVSEASVTKCINTLKGWHRTDPGCPIEIVFNSPGGTIFDGFFLFDYIQDLRAAGHHVTTGTYGMAASMAGVLLQAGDVRYATKSGWLMIHRAAFGAAGSITDIEDQTKLVQRLENRILDIFEERSNLSKTQIKRRWDRKDWWLDAGEALDHLLVDEIRGQAN